MAESLSDRIVDENAGDLNGNIDEDGNKEVVKEIVGEITEGLAEDTAAVVAEVTKKKKKKIKVKRPKVQVIPEKVKKLSLTKEERIGIILLCGSRSLRQTAEDFNKANPEREKITHSCVSKLLAKFRETGSILDKPHVAKKRVTDETTSAYILAKFSMNPSSSIRRMALETNVSKTSIRRILRANRVVTLSSLGMTSSNYNHGASQSTGTGFQETAAKKKPARPRKQSATKPAASNNLGSNSAANTAHTVTSCHQQQQQQQQHQQQQHEQMADRWQQHNQQQLHHVSNEGLAYMNEYKEMPILDYQTGNQIAMVPVGVKSPKAQKAAQASVWNAPAVGYGYGAPLMYQPNVGYIDSVTQ